MDNAPVLESHLVDILHAFSELDLARDWTMGCPLPIKLTEIEAYARIHDYTGEELDDLILHLRNLDTQYLEHAAEKREREAKKHGGRKP